MTILVFLGGIALGAAPGGDAHAWMGWGFRWQGEGAARTMWVARVAPFGPAARAGIQPGDIVVAIDGRSPTISDELELLLLLASHKPGDRLSVEYVRSGRRARTVVTLGTMPRELIPAWERGLAVARQQRALRH